MITKNMWSWCSIKNTILRVLRKPNESYKREKPPITPIHRLIAEPKVVDIFELLKLIYGADFKNDEGFQFYTNFSLDVVENMMPDDQCDFPDIEPSVDIV